MANAFPDIDDFSAPSSAEKILITELLQRYEAQGKHGRPVTDTMDNLTVYFGLSLIQILDVDESNQVLKCNVWYHYEWTDILLQWNPAGNDDIRDVRVPSQKIWLPDLQLYNFADDRLREQRDALVVVNYTGKTLWMPQAILRSSCAFDTKYFPFDVQTCNLKFGSWTYNGNKLNIEFVAAQAFDLSDFVVSNEWDITENYAKRNVQYYTCCPDEPYPDLTFTLTLRRKVAFYTFILVLPCALLSLLTLVIFWVPPESPAKLQLGMSVFVAFFFLLLVLADFTPRAAASIPLIGAYFCLSMVMITLSTVLACVVANMYFRGVRVNEAPLWLKVIMIDWLSHILCVQNRVRRARKEQPGLTKRNWNTCITKDMNGKPSDNDFRYAKVRLLDNGVDSRVSLEPSKTSSEPRMLAQQESFDSCNFECYSDRGAPAGNRFGPLLEEVKGIKDVLQRYQDRQDSVEERERLVREWRVIACVTDRLFFIMYVIINFVGLMVIFLGT
nr:hypothetical protein BaRGS_001100 [Batillaria attramentaria]